MDEDTESSASNISHTGSISHIKLGIPSKENTDVIVSKDENAESAKTNLNTEDNMLSDTIKSIPTIEHEKTDGNLECAGVEMNENDTVFKVPVPICGIRKKKKLFTTLKHKQSEEPNIKLIQKPPEESSKEEKSVNSEECGVDEDYNDDDPQDYFGYKIPKWSKMPPTDYFVIEEWKDDECTMQKYIRKEFYLFGRKENCHVVSRHGSISRYHSVIQYGSPSGKDDAVGFYIFDMNTCHGTFINLKRIESMKHVKLEVDLSYFSLGYSTRRYLITSRGKKIGKPLESKPQDDGNSGINWGMGDDADEETDLSTNPFAEEHDEEFYINDPKKTLKGWFEREGKELIYDVEEKRFGEYRCSISIPIDDIGETLVAQATVKGKKREAVVQAALEACRILDRHEQLRQTHHHAKEKTKDWAANDYYDSDDDSFFDRTGDIDKKRLKRIKKYGKEEDKVEVHTYDSLLADHKVLLDDITRMKQHYAKLTQEKIEAEKLMANLSGKNDEEIELLDVYDECVNSLDLIKPDIVKIENTLRDKYKEEKRLCSLINMAKPADLPPLAPLKQVFESDENIKKPLVYPGFGIHSLLPINEKRKRSRIGSLKYERDALKPEPKCETAVREPELKSPKPVSAVLEVQNDDAAERSSGDEPPKKITKIDSKEGEKLKVVTKKREKSDFQKQASTKVRVKPAPADESEWTPPAGQTGDGRTHLNDKFGY